MGAMPLVGLDLDNTLIDYGAVFGSVGVELGLLPTEAFGLSKNEVRALLRGQAGGEQLWMRLQGQVYGRCLPRARLYPGVGAALRHLSELGAEFCIVSHKTRTGHFDPDRVDLWQAARDWIARQSELHGAGFSAFEAGIHFLETREAKITKISALRCDAFIDDLPEVLLHPNFPATTARFWFAPKDEGETDSELPPHRTWEELGEAMESHLFSGANRG